MKNNYLLSGIAFIVGAILLGGCKKEAVAPPSENSISVSSTSGSPGQPGVKSGRLIFGDRESYENFLTENHSDSGASFRRIKSFPGFTSMLDYYKHPASGDGNWRVVSDTLPFEDVYIANFLTPEGVIQIGNYIFKINMNKEKVFVMNAADEEAHMEDLLNENITQNVIREFNTSDEVLTLLEEKQKAGASERTTLFCRAHFANHDHDKDQEMIYYGANGAYRLDCKVVYQRAGIYFSLQAKVKSQAKDIFGIWTSHPITTWANYEASWTPRCKGYTSVSDECSSCWSTGDKLTRRLYSSSRALSSYSYRIRFINQWTNYVTRDFYIYG